ncbi:restriction endonuclease subunit S [Streptomyces sp. NPDC093510]|uniref:restriction endonuclease subunit S n=1 Tax=Streptomyces sp. NPDC093510 TaxID=3155199 RepID=UPI003438DB6E
MSEWTRTTLDQLVKLRRGHDLPTTSRNPGNVPVVGAAGPSGFHDTAIAKAPGVVVGRAGASMGHATYCAEDFWPLNTSLYVTDFLGNDPRFVYHLLGEIDFSGYNSGAAQPMLNRNYITQIPISLPDPDEQRAIAAVLGALDDKIAVNERAAATGDALAKARYGQAGRGLCRDAPLGQLATVVVGGTPSRSKSEYWTRGTVNWINSGKANEFRVVEPSEMITESGLAGSSVKMMPPGATLIGITGATMGKISRLEILAGGSQNVAGVWSSNPALSDWLFFDIRARVADLIKHASGGAQQHINKRVITELQCAVPDRPLLTEWHAIASPLLARVAHSLMENQTLATLRDTLLPQLMSGRLRVKDAEKIVEDHV